jgi:GntR family transcriptional regulator
VREVVTQITINPNTVHRAYRELESAGVTEARQGLGTFVAEHNGAPHGLTPVDQAALLDDLGRWVARAQEAGLDEDGIRALVSEALDGATSSLSRRGGTQQ